MNVDPARVAEGFTHAAAALIAFRRTRPGTICYAPTLRPMWLFLIATLFADAVRLGLQEYVLRVASRPFVGLARVAFHIDQLGVIGWNVGLLAVVMFAFTSRLEPRPRVLPIVLFAIALMTSFVLAYPTLRGERLAIAYTLLQVATVIGCAVVVVRAWRRGAWFGIAPRAASLLVAAEAATLFGPFLGKPFENWTTANVISAVAYTLLAKELRTRGRVFTCRSMRARKPGEF